MYFVCVCQVYIKVEMSFILFKKKNQSMFLPCKCFILSLRGYYRLELDGEKMFILSNNGLISIHVIIPLSTFSF